MRDSLSGTKIDPRMNDRNSDGELWVEARVRFVMEVVAGFEELLWGSLARSGVVRYVSWSWRWYWRCSMTSLKRSLDSGQELSNVIGFMM